MNIIDLTGQQFGNLTVIKITEPRKTASELSKKRTHWLCKCKCGKEISVMGSRLKNGKTKSCGCLRKNPKKLRVDLTGQRFGKLLVIKRIAPKLKNELTKKYINWLCKCDCGKEVSVRGYHLKNKETRSCGCLKTASDLTGHIFGNLTVIKLDIQNPSYWLCECTCKNIVSIKRNSLIKAKTKSCGCLRREQIIKSMTGLRFGRLTVIGRDSNKSTPENSYWICKCDCGNTISVINGALKNGNTKSCKCLRKEENCKSKLEFPWLASKNFLINSYKASSKKRNLIFDITEEECEFLFKGNCEYCGIAPTNVINAYKKDIETKKYLERANYTFNGIDRVNNTLGYVLENCVSCCKICNFAKSNIIIDEWLLWIDRLINFQSKKIELINNNTHTLIIPKAQHIGLNTLIRGYREQAKQRILPFELTKEECHQIFKSNCSYCGVEPTNYINAYLRKDGQPNVYSVRKNKNLKNLNIIETTYFYNGIDRVDPFLGYLCNNDQQIQCVPCCFICNRAKCDMSPSIWEKWLCQIVKFQTSKVETKILN